MATQFGKDYGLVHEAIVTGRKVGAGKEFWARFAHDEEKFKQVVELVMNLICLVARVVVDYGKNLHEMIVEGAYDNVNSDITAENFPVKGEGKCEREIALFHFNRYISSDDAIKEMATTGYRPATIEDLLALGKVKPDLQRQFPIVALGSVWRYSDGNRYVAYLRRCDARRTLDLRYFDDDWGGCDRFAAVRNA